MSYDLPIMIITAGGVILGSFLTFLIYKQYINSKNNHEKYLFYFYFFFVLQGISSFIMKVTYIWNLAGVGITLIFTTFNSYSLFYYGLDLFYKGNYKRSKKIRGYSIFFLIVSFILSGYISIIVAIYHGYENIGLVLPIWVIPIGSIFLIMHITIYFGIIGFITRLLIQIFHIPQEHFEMSKKSVITKILWIEFGGIFLLIFAICLFIDLISSERTILALIAWILYSFIMITIFLGYNHPNKA